MFMLSRANASSFHDGLSVNLWCSRRRASAILPWHICLHDSGLENSPSSQDAAISLAFGIERMIVVHVARQLAH
jgi:hypothetical protein